MSRSSISPGPPKRILVASDQSSSSCALVKSLSAAGYEVLQADCAEGAIEQAIAEKPAAAFVALPLLGGGGYEAESALCQACCALTPVFFGIGQTSDPERVACVLEAGGADFLNSSMSPEEILVRLRHHLSLAAQRQKQEYQIEYGSRPSGLANSAVAGVIHDLKNLFLSIGGLTEILAAQPADQGAEITEAILGASKEGLSRVNTALDEMLSGRQSTISIAPHDLEEILEAAVRNSSGWAERKGIGIQIVGSGQGISYPCDREKLLRAVENLVSNAVKFSPQGSVVEVDAGMTHSNLTIAVRDEGPGFSTGNPETPAGAKPVSATAGETGFGLGLGICQEIVVAHQGRIECRNRTPRGSEFIINLPLGRNAA